MTFRSSPTLSATLLTPERERNNIALARVSSRADGYRSVAVKDRTAVDEASSILSAPSASAIR